MRRLTIGLVAMVMAGSGSALAQTPPDGLTWMALSDINAAHFDPEDPTNRPPLLSEPPPGMIRAVEINGDGRPDWLIDYGQAGLSQFCGTGGCLRRLYVSGGDTGYRRAFDAQALALEIVERDGETHLEIQAHALHCPSERPTCLFAWAWDEEQGRLVERASSDGATVLLDGGFDPVALEAQDLPDSLPPALSQQWFGGRLTCQDQSDAGFETRRPAFRSIPDINGDGARDWIEIPALCPEDDAETRFAVWASDSDGGLSEVYVSPVETYPAIDIAETPATLIARPDCGPGVACPVIRLRWQERVRRLVPET